MYQTKLGMSTGGKANSRAERGQIRPDQALGEVSDPPDQAGFGGAATLATCA
jgi:hypothetical protein